MTGLQAANHAIQYCGQGRPASIIPLEPEEEHVIAARKLVHLGRTLQELNPLASLVPSLL